jgi:hypothetical protein
VVEARRQSGLADHGDGVGGLGSDGRWGAPESQQAKDKEAREAPIRNGMQICCSATGVRESCGRRP